MRASTQADKGIPVGQDKAAILSEGFNVRKPHAPVQNDLRPGNMRQRHLTGYRSQRDSRSGLPSRKSLTLVFRRAGTARSAWVESYDDGSHRRQHRFDSQRRGFGRVRPDRDSQSMIGRWREQMEGPQSRSRQPRALEAE